MTLSLQYENGRLTVFVLKNKLTNEIHGILDTFDNAISHQMKLSKLGFSTKDWIIDAYRVIEN